LRPYNILCFNGGGVRGLFQTQLMHLLTSRDNFQPHEAFDLIAGTSIGSFNALCAASGGTGLNFALLKQVFEANVSHIFPGDGRLSILEMITKRGAVFSPSSLRRVSDTLLKTMRLSDTKSDFLCTTSSISSFKSRTLSSFPSDEYRSLQAVDAVMASCAAPIFFPPHTIKELQQDFIDGGVWANSPILAAVLAANRFRGVPFQAMRVIVLGTGYSPGGITAKELKEIRPVSAASAQLMLELFNTSQMDASATAAKQLIGDANVVVIEPTLRKRIPLYDATLALNEMPGIAEEFYQSSRDLLLSIKRKSGTTLDHGASHPQLATSEMIHAAGLSKVIPKRKYYSAFRDGGGNIEDYLGTAVTSIKMVSINMITGVRFENIMRVFEEKLNRFPSFSVVLSLIDPKREDLMRFVSSSISDEYAVSAEALSDQINETLQRLTRFRRTLSVGASKRFDIRVHATLPFASAIMIDSDASSGKIQLETKPYREPLVDSFAFEVVDVGDDCLFKTLRRAYGRLLDDAVPVHDDARR